MKKHIYLLLILASQNLFAQKAAKISFNSTNKKAIFKPIIKQLTKQDKYKFNLPYHLTYFYGPDDLLSNVFTATNAVGIKASYNDTRPNYIFDVEMQGMEETQAPYNRWHRDNVGGPKGFVKDIKYIFPCTLVIKEVQEKETVVLRRIELFKKENIFTATYDSGYFTGVFVPYVTQDGLNNAYDANKLAFLKTVETRIAQSAYSQISQILIHFFNEFNTGKMPYSYANVKEKKRKFDYADLDTATAHFKIALDSFFIENNSEAKKSIVELVNFYEKLLDSKDERIDNNVKDMLRFNLSTCNLLLGDLEKSQDYFNKSTMQDIGSGDYYKSELKSLLQIYGFRKRLEMLTQPQK